jgi:hypothetical protein
MEDLLTDIKAALDGLDLDRARLLLREALQHPTADIYVLAAQAALSDEQRRRFLEAAVALDPFHEKAVSALGQMSITNRGQPVEVTDLPAAVGPRFVTARVASFAGTLARFPWPGAPPRTSLAPGSEVALIERTESGAWLNVIYLGTTGREIVGWLPADHVSDIRLGESTVHLSDLPITAFEHNTRDDIVDLTHMVRQANGTANTLVAGGGGLVTLGLMWGLIVGSSGSGSVHLAIMAVSVLVGLAGVIFIAFGIPRVNRLSADVRNHLGWRDMAGIFNRLERLRRSKQDLSETHMEHQARLQAMNIAGAMLTKVTPEFNDLVALTRRK